MSAAVPASSWREAIAAWIWYGPGRRASERLLDQLLPFGDPIGIPEAAILVVEQDQLACRSDTRLASGVVEEHEGQQSGRLGLIGEQRHHGPCQPDRLGAQLAPDERITRGGRIPLVEDEIQHAQDTVQPLGKQLRRRDTERDARVPDLALRSDEALSEGRLGDEKGARDLGRGQPTERPQRERDPCVHRESRVAAREDEPQSVVWDRHRVLRGRGLERRQSRIDRRLARQLLGLLDQPLPPAEPIDRPVPGRRRDPGTRVVGNTADRPCLERGDERVLDRFLRKVEVAGDANERRDRTALLVTEQAVDDRSGGLRCGRSRRLVRDRQSPAEAAVAADAGAFATARL